MKQYELWRSEDGEQDSLFPADNESARELLEPDATLIWVVKAISWEEAQQKRCDYMGWGRNCTVKEEIES